MGLDLQHEIEKYYKTIADLVVLPDSEEKSLHLSEALSNYYCFCYKNNIIVSLPNFAEIEKCSYILPSKPEILSLDLKSVEEAAANLENALQINSGITLNEANLLLTYVVQKAREILKESCGDIANEPLTGYCGLGQVLTLLPFKMLGVNVTINNANQYPYSKIHHGFGTVTLPINKNGKIINKTYLLDVTYRQFFTTLTCHNGRFFSANPSKKDKVGPNAGYYIKKYPGGIDFAMELLKKGYIEIDDEKAKIYGVCFSAQALNKNNLSKLEDIFALDSSFYYKILAEKQVKFTYNFLELAEISERIKVPINAQIYR